MPEESAIFAELEAVVADCSPRRVAELEDTLTSGYALALALEAERARLDRRLADVLASDVTSRDALELAELARLRAGVEERLASLRALLAPLRLRAKAARVA